MTYESAFWLYGFGMVGGQVIAISGVAAEVEWGRKILGRSLMALGVLMGLAATIFALWVQNR